MNVRARMRQWLGIDDLVVGAHCGCCGAWIEDAVVERCPRITLCLRCIKKANIRAFLESMAEGARTTPGVLE